MAEIVAVLPRIHSTAKIVHLHLPGYQPGHKARSSEFPVSMCGSTCVLAVRPEGMINPGPTGLAHVGIKEARRVIAESHWLRWCAPCLGRAIDHSGLDDRAAALIAEVNR